MTTLAWIISITLILTGIAGTILPLLPGIVLVWVGILIHKLMIPDTLSWWTVGITFVLAAAGFLLDYVAGAFGAKKFGASKYGIWGAVSGGIVGLFFGPPGIIIGPLVGALVGELIFARKKLGASAKAAAGTGLGMIFGALARISIAVVMTIIFFVDVFWK